MNVGRLEYNLTYSSSAPAKSIACLLMLLTPVRPIPGGYTNHLVTYKQWGKQAHYTKPHRKQIDAGSYWVILNSSIYSNTVRTECPNKMVKIFVIPLWFFTHMDYACIKFISLGSPGESWRTGKSETCLSLRAFHETPEQFYSCIREN